MFTLHPHEIGHAQLLILEVRVCCDFQVEQAVMKYFTLYLTIVEIQTTNRLN